MTYGGVTIVTPGCYKPMFQCQVHMTDDTALVSPVEHIMNVSVDIQTHPDTKDPPRS